VSPTSYTNLKLNNMKDICYKCGIAQEYGTMRDVDEFSFEILCDSCYETEEINDKFREKY